MNMPNSKRCMINYSDYLVAAKEEFERALNAEIAKFETMIDKQDKENAAIQKDFDTMEKDFNVSR